jgi:S-DNA-T family DNA segregation ATPase FtsK/SpoIIIE
MKTLRLVSSPTRNHRLNEIVGMVVLVAAALMLLALASYTPTDPSFDTVGGVGWSFAGIARPAHNWTGLVGAYFADALLQIFGVAAFLLPLLPIRLGICWLRSRPFGSVGARLTGVGLWAVFGPAAISLLPGHALYKDALPVAGLSGRLLGDAMIAVLNLPGTAIVVGLMVALSFYLGSTFTFDTAREWASERFGFLAGLRERLTSWRRRGEVSPEMVDENGEEFGARRLRIESEARRMEEKQAREANAEASSNTLLGGLFSWWNRRRNEVPESVVPAGEEAPLPAASVWRGMPRTIVDGPASTPLGLATAAAAPFAEALAAAAAPLRQETIRQEEFGHEELVAAETPAPRPVPAARAVARVEEKEEEPFSFLSKPANLERVVPPTVPAPAPAAALPEAATGGPISFGKRADSDIKAVAITAKSVRGYKLPSSSLLYQSEDHPAVREDALREEARVLVEKCGEFGVDGQVTQINPGPVVTTFEFRPDAGVKYARITGLADDLCLAMAAESILIERMPGKSTVGIQVPNHERETIWLRDVVECESFAQSKSKLAIALGKDINGGIVTADLAGMPHVLIAGSTGSGKSVAINAMIMSVLFKSTPEQVRMILVDPKRVELGMYEGIPHLFTPIITEAKLAANALRNAVREMERRLKLLAANHVRNIDQFNKLFDHGSSYLFEDVNQEPLPYIIIIIDELADLMMLDRSNVEESITRLAQMARAVGIHLILATQRPSVDVITGLIKANVPTRMSFRLATKVDSRTIIDSNGAESLLGRGDMLYLPPGTSRLQRVHAPFVTEKEIAAVTEFWRAQGEAEYVEGFLEGPKDEGDPDQGGEPGSEVNDELFEDAVRLVFEFGKASTSLLQRRLRIGYGRAAALIDMMYNDGLVGPADGSKPRELLKSPEFYKEVDGAMR